MNLPTMMVVIGANTVGLNKAVGDLYRMKRAVSATTSSMNTSLATTNAALVTLGRNLTMFVSVPLGLIGFAATKAFGDFEYSLAKITGLVGIASQQTKEWGKDILNMAPAIGKGPQELADALYFITSSGFKTSESMKILDISARAAAAGLGETKDVANIVTSAMNAYGQSAMTAVHATDVLTMAVREGKGEPPELVRAFATVIPIAAKLGVEFNQVGGALAAMTRLGIPAATASTYLRQTLFTLIKPSKQTRDGLKAIGLTAQEVRDSLQNNGLLDTMIMLTEATKNLNEEALGRIFPNIRAFMGITSIVNKNLGDTVEVFDNVANAAGTTALAFQTVSETMKFKWNAAMSEGKALLITLGESISRSLLPIIEGLLNVFDDLGRWFGNLSRGTQDLIVKFGGLLFALGPILLIFTGIKSIWKSSGALIKTLTTNTEALTVANNAAAASSLKLAAAQKVQMASSIGGVNRPLSVVSSSGDVSAKIISSQIAASAAMKTSTSATNAATIAATRFGNAQQDVSTATDKTKRAQDLLAKTQQTLVNEQKFLAAAQLATIKPYEKLARAQAAVNNLMNERNIAEVLGMRTSEALNSKDLVYARLKRAKLEVLKAEAAVTTQLNAVKLAEAQVIRATTINSQLDNTLREKKIILAQAETTLTIKQARAKALEAAAIRAATAADKVATIAKKQAAFANATLFSSYGPLLTQVKAVTGAQLTGITVMRNATSASILAQMAGRKAVLSTIPAIGAATAAWNTFTAAISKIGFMGWVAIIGIATFAIYKLYQALTKLTVAEQTQKDLLEKVGDAYGEEAAKVQTYLAIAKNEYATLKEREAAIKRLNEISPAYLGNLTLESINTDVARRSLDAYNKMLFATMVLKEANAAADAENARYAKSVVTEENKRVGLWDRIKNMKNIYKDLTAISAVAFPALMPVFAGAKGKLNEQELENKAAEKSLNTHKEILKTINKYQNQRAVLLDQAVTEKAFLQDSYNLAIQKEKELQTLKDKTNKTQEDKKNLVKVTKEQQLVAKNTLEGMQKQEALFMKMINHANNLNKKKKEGEIIDKKVFDEAQAQAAYAMANISEL